MTLWKAKCWETSTLRLEGGSWKSASLKVTRWLPTLRGVVPRLLIVRPDKQKEQRDKSLPSCG